MENEETVVEDASKVDLDMGEERECVIKVEVREENVNNKFLKTEEDITLFREILVRI